MDNPWVLYSDRRPTKDDGDGYGLVLVKYASGEVRTFCYSNSHSEYQVLAWMRLCDLPPIPKRKVWREPTQADLDAATEPIPCRAWGLDSDRKKDGKLMAISKFSESRCRFITNATRWEHCEIEVDE